MIAADRFRLLFGPYPTPRFRHGRRARCAMRGEVVMGCRTAGGAGVSAGPPPAACAAPR
jgi:hypothetical protein